ncbi:MAG: hypothetical protein K1X31_15430, partial [Gemmatimonadaceae bacterium]|nr:hypothetical protein [Gemmatimonadaceae bacterium]
MPHVRREEALVRAARRRQALSLRLWWAIGMLAVLGGWLVWREHEAVLGSVVERASATAAHEAATLAERQRDAATLVAQRLASPPVGRSAVPAGPRTPGADALEYILTDEASRLAIGGVLEVAGASPAPGVRDVALAAVAAQRAVLDATPGLEAVYVAFPEARIVSRVPYVGAEQLRVRTRDARLAPWFTGAFLEDAVHDELVDGSPVIADEPATGVPVLRLDRPVAGIARGIRARVIVTVPVEAYLEAAARTEYPVRAVSGLVAPDGTVVAARAPG